MKGVYTALITPFTAANGIDWDSFHRILDDQRAAGVTGVIPCGTTGESPTLSEDEKKLLIAATLRRLQGSGLLVIAGTGHSDTASTVELSAWAAAEGADAVLVVTPYYNKPSPAGLKNHFSLVADAVTATSPRCEVMLYNVPSRTGVSLSASTIATLAKHPRIRSLKEATANMAFSSEVLDVLRSAGCTMDILSGDDATFLPLLSIGATGVVSVASNLFPRAMVAILRLFREGRNAEALELHSRYYPLFRDLFIESNPGPLKSAMARAGWCHEFVRSPLALISDSTRKQLDESLNRCGINAGVDL